jgi:chromosome segregation ATPase
MAKISTQEDQKYKRKYEELKRKLKNLEENNKTLDLKIIKAKNCIKRLKVEKGFLFEKLDKIKNNDLDSEDSEIENNTPQQPIKVEEKHQRKKQKVDPLAPKKPANAFFRFCQHQRKDMNSQINQIKSEDSSNSDITKILSNQWKQLPQEEKQICKVPIKYYFYII